MSRKSRVRIEDLYSLIPGLDCPGGCIACCRVFGIPSQTRIETKQIDDYLAAEGRGKKNGPWYNLPLHLSRGLHHLSRTAFDLPSLRGGAELSLPGRGPALAPPP